VKSISEKIVAGDIRAVARLLRDLDENENYVDDVLKELYPYTGRAYIVGVTGAPGTGKSTLVDKIISRLRQLDKKVGVLAVDPTSHQSGGAVLGDRIRMSQHSLDNDVFIRSMATRNAFGGLTRSTRGSIDILDAMGKDFIIVETVGVGQNEVDIARYAHTTVIVTTPGMGDGIQALKAGILEVGDIFVVNKADRNGADATFIELEIMVNMGPRKHQPAGWVPPVIKTQALFDDGVGDLIKKIETHRQWVMDTFKRLSLWRRENWVKEELLRMIKETLIDTMIEKIIKGKGFEETVASIAKGQENPYDVSKSMAKKELRSMNDFVTTEDNV
jgi:LAO/AO transport system kinase